MREQSLSGAQVPASSHHSHVTQAACLANPGTVQPQTRWGRHPRLWVPGVLGATSAGTWYMERSPAMKKSLIQDMYKNSDLEESPWGHRLLKTTTRDEIQTEFICGEVKHVFYKIIKQLSQWLYTQWFSHYSFVIAFCYL